MSKDIKIGCSIYSFTYFYDLRLMDLEDLLKTAHEMGYEGIEIVVAQMAPEYPNITDEWIKNFRELLDKYQLHLVSWSAYIDMGLRADRDLTDEEIREHTRRDLILAKKAGADLVRTQHALKFPGYAASVQTVGHETVYRDARTASSGCPGVAGISEDHGGTGERGISGCCA